MRMISLLIGLMIVGFIMTKLLALNARSVEVENVIKGQSLDLPKVPVVPKDVESFGVEMEGFIQNTTDKRNQELEQALNK